LLAGDFASPDLLISNKFTTNHQTFSSFNFKKLQKVSVAPPALRVWQGSGCGATSQGLRPRLASAPPPALAVGHS